MLITLIARAVLVLSLVGLGSTASFASATPKVVASIAPLHSLVAAVMDGVAEPQLLSRAGESPHSLGLRPSDARNLHQADLLFWIGPPLERPLQRLLPALDDTRSISMLGLPEIKTLAARHLATHSPPHQPAESAAVDPHIWLSPANAIVMTEGIARALVAEDPANAKRYRNNALRTQARLSTLDRDLRNMLGAVEGPYAVFHDAYQYLEHRYGLRSIGAITSHPERNPGAGHLSELRAQLATGQIRCVFSEPQFQPRLVKVLREGLPVRHAVLDPLGAGIAPGVDAYDKLMRTIAERLSHCMRGEQRI